jgi:2-keto-4-pentenoate hydratase
VSPTPTSQAATSQAAASQAAASQTAAQLLADARIVRKRLAELPQAVRPQSPDEAYAVQDGLIERLLDHYGGSIIGYKIACTNLTAQQQLNVDGPFRGRLLSHFCRDSPAHLDTGDFFMRVVEAEFAFRMARDLPPLSKDGPRRREEIADAIEGVIPAIEIVDSRFDEWTTIGAPSLIADNACNAAWVKGPLLTRWRDIDLATQQVRVIVNGRLEREGSGANVLGHPLSAMEWLVNSLAAAGLGLKAGQHVTTGVTTVVYMAERGDHIIADFGPVGSAEVTFY